MNTRSGRIGRRPTSGKQVGTKRKYYDKYREKKRKLIVWLGDRCVDCKKSYHLEVYDFHHRDPSTKKFGLFMSRFSKKWADLKDEVAKCDLLCPTCHRIRHVKIWEKEREENDRTTERTNGTSETTGPRKGTQATLPGI